MTKKPIFFTPNYDSIIDGICYLATKKPEQTLGVHQTMKLFFFADVKHMNKKLLPIFGGIYKALRYGPIHQEALDVINGIDAGRSDESENLPFYRKNNQIIFHQRNPNREERFLSKSNKEVLDEIWQEYHDKDFETLTKLSHNHPAWQKAWNSRMGHSNEMDYHDFYDAKIISKDDIKLIEQRAADIPI